MGSADTLEGGEIEGRAFLLSWELHCLLRRGEWDKFLTKLASPTGQYAVQRVSSRNKHLLHDPAVYTRPAPVEVMQKIIKTCPRGLRTKDSDGFYPIHVALSHGADVSVVQCMLQADPFCTSHQDRRGYTALHVAIGCRSRNPRMVKLLLQNCRTGDLHRSTIHGMIPLHLACASSSVDSPTIVAILNAYPAGAKAVDSSGCLPLHHACKTGKSRVVEKLLLALPAGSRSMNVHMQLPIHLAGFKLSPRAFQTLLESYPSCVTHRDPRGLLPIHYIAVEAVMSDDIKPWEAIVSNIIDAYPKGLLQCPTPIGHILKSSPSCLNSPIGKYLVRQTYVQIKGHQGTISGSVGSDSFFHQLCLCASAFHSIPAKILVDALNEQINCQGRDGLEDTDSEGNSPLHLICKGSLVSNTEEAQCHKTSGILANTASPVQCLLEHAPGAAQMMNTNGELPLNILLNESRCLSCKYRDVALLSKRSFDVAASIDPEKRMYPFMVAASGTHPCLSSTFDLFQGLVAIRSLSDFGEVESS